MRFADILQSGNMRFKKWEIVPYTFEIKISTVTNITEYSEYTREFTPPERFLLRRVLTKTELTFIRLGHGTREMYLGPGWLHTRYDTALVVPELFLNLGRWTIQVGIDYWNYETYGNAIKIALQGERIVEL